MNIQEQATAISKDLVLTATNTDYEDLRTEMTTMQVMKVLWGSEPRVSATDRLSLATGIINNLLLTIQVLSDEIAHPGDAA